MKHTLKLLTALLLGPLSVLQAAEPGTSPASAPTPAGLTKGPNATLLRDGKPCRGIGINYFDCFLRTLNKGDDTSYDAGFATLAAKGIPFALLRHGLLAAGHAALSNGSRGVFPAARWRGEVR